MKTKFLVLLAILCCVFATCCAPRATPPVSATNTTAAPTKAPDVTTVRASRTFELTLHVDMAFNEQGRAIIEEAAHRWSVLTRGRAELTIVFDVDFDSITNLKQHKANGDSLVLGIESDYPIADAIDQALAGGRPGKVLAATVHEVDENTGPILVFLIVDRIVAANFLSVVTHEFGHVIGLPDLPTTGSIMSGAEITGVAPPDTFTPADIALCRAAHFCD